MCCVVAFILGWASRGFEGLRGASFSWYCNLAFLKVAFFATDWSHWTVVDFGVV